MLQHSGILSCPAAYCCGLHVACRVLHVVRCMRSRAQQKTCYNIGILYRRLGHADKAVEYLSRDLAISTRTLGADHAQATRRRLPIYSVPAAARSPAAQFGGVRRTAVAAPTPRRLPGRQGIKVICGTGYSGGIHGTHGTHRSGTRLSGTLAHERAASRCATRAR